MYQIQKSVVENQPKADYYTNLMVGYAKNSATIMKSLISLAFTIAT